MTQHAASETISDSSNSLLHWHSYYQLCKPKVILLIVFTAIVGMLLASQNGLVPLAVLLPATLGIGLAAASGAALNHLIDQRIDAIMERTHNRPLPSGEIDSRHALVFALALAVIAMLTLYLWVNTLTAVLTFFALIGYAVIYTVFLKRSTPQNIVFGGAAGAAPPILGWTAVSGEVTAQAILLFLIIFVWTPPHFWALAIRRRKEYAKAGVPMLPVTHGVDFTKKQIMLYTMLLFAVSLMPVVIHMSGVLYLAGAVSLGVGFLYQAWLLYRSDTDKEAMKTFGYSIFYLSLLFGFLLADHYARILIKVYFP